MISDLTILFVAHAKSIFGDDFIPLYRSVFEGSERHHLIDCIDKDVMSFSRNTFWDARRSVT